MKEARRLRGGNESIPGEGTPVEKIANSKSTFYKSLEPNFSDLALALGIGNPVVKQAHRGFVEIHGNVSNWLSRSVSKWFVVGMEI